MASKPKTEFEVPSPHNWRTTDEDEINRRRARARMEDFRGSKFEMRKSSIRARARRRLISSSSVVRQLCGEGTSNSVFGLLAMPESSAVGPKSQNRVIP